MALSNRFYVSCDGDGQLHCPGRQLHATDVGAVAAFSFKAFTNT